MAIKNIEVKHFLVTGGIETLNEFVSSKLSEGWEYVDSKISTYDPYNQLFVILYIFKTKG